MAVSTRLAEPSDFDTAMEILGPFAFGLSGGGWPLEDAAALASARTLWTDELCGSRLRGQVFLAEDGAGKLLGVATQSFAVAMRMAVVSARAEETHAAGRAHRRGGRQRQRGGADPGTGLLGQREGAGLREHGAVCRRRLDVPSFLRKARLSV
eukprot:COSAG06_NODE_1245_length_10117_cov_28.671990_3_plen_153_part_00